MGIHAGFHALENINIGKERFSHNYSRVVQHTALGGVSLAES